MNMRGFTLLEVTMYIGLFSILMGGSITAAYRLMQSGAHNQQLAAIQEEGTFINRKINWALTGASSVSLGGGNTLTITRPDLGAQSPLVIAGSGGDVTLMRSGSTETILNNPAIPVQNISFAVTPVAFGRPTEVDVSFTIGETPFVFKKYLRQ